MAAAVREVRQKLRMAAAVREVRQKLRMAVTAREGDESCEWLPQPGAAVRTAKGFIIPEGTEI